MILYTKKSFCPVCKRDRNIRIKEYFIDWDENMLYYDFQCCCCKNIIKEKYVLKYRNGKMLGFSV